MRGGASSTTLHELAATYREPQLATLAERLPRGGSWTYELKFDGYRILAIKVGTRVRLASRRAKNWTAEFDEVAAAVAKLARHDVVLDGEVCALDERGVPSFQALQNRGARRARIVYFVFDLLEEDGVDLRGRPLEERRARLGAILAAGVAGGVIAPSSAVRDDPDDVLKVALEIGVEGVVAKQCDAPYVAGRSRTWVKVKCFGRQEFAIVGWLPLSKTRPLVGALLLAVIEADGQLHYAGKVGTGFTDAARKALFDMLSREGSATPTALDVPRFGGTVRFVKALHVAEVRFMEWTSGGHVRHPSFQGLRQDKRPDECVREEERRR